MSPNREEGEKGVMGMTREEAIKRLKEAKTTIQPFRYVDEAIDYAIKALEQEPCEDCVSREEVKKIVDFYKTMYDGICRVNEDIDKLTSVTPQEPKQEPILDKIREEIKEWYWQADKQTLAKDPCVVDAMIDLFIRTIDKYKTESEGKE